MRDVRERWIGTVLFATLAVAGAGPLSAQQSPAAPPATFHHGAGHARSSGAGASGEAAEARPGSGRPLSAIRISTPTTNLPRRK